MGDMTQTASALENEDTVTHVREMRHIIGFDVDRGNHDSLDPSVLAVLAESEGSLYSMEDLPEDYWLVVE